MAPKNHDYTTSLRWNGNTGTGTSSYNSYDRNWEICTHGKQVIHCSNDPLLGGDPTKHNPEDLLINALASCHMLWYLHLCAVGGVVVVSYNDNPLAIGELEPSGAGKFVSVTLRPQIEISAESDFQKAEKIHLDIHQYCFIARSVNFPVNIMPEISFAD